MEIQYEKILNRGKVSILQEKCFKDLLVYELCVYLAPEIFYGLNTMAKIKYTLEFEMKSTPVPLLWSYLATANGLKEWFADNAEMHGKDVVFSWKGAEQPATIIAMRTEKYVRYRWKDEDDKSYFELRVDVSEMTDTTLLTVTDFAEPDELEESKNLWNYQVEVLQRLLGC